AVAAIACEPRHREGEHGAQSLAAGGNQVVGHLRDHGDVRAGTRQDDGVDPLHIGGQEADQARDGWGGRVFERDNDGQGLTPAGKGRATIETLWWTGKRRWVPVHPGVCTPQRSCGASDEVGQCPERAWPVNEEWHVRQEAPAALEGESKLMREIVRTNDDVLVTVIESLLGGAKIPHMVLDRNMSVLEGSIGILPRRILVAEDRADEARKLLEDAGLGHELRPDKP